MICPAMGRDAAEAQQALGSFHVHAGHAFEGVQIQRRRGETILLARCTCGAVLDVADAAFAPCPECGGEGPCPRCGGTGLVIDHAALEWRLPTEKEERDADRS